MKRNGMGKGFVEREEGKGEKNGMEMDYSLNRQKTKPRKNRIGMNE